MARQRCLNQEKALKLRLSGRKSALIFDNEIKPKHPSPFASHHTCLLPFFSDFCFFFLSFAYLSSPCSTPRHCCSKGEHWGRKRLKLRTRLVRRLTVTVKMIKTLSAKFAGSYSTLS